MDVKSKKPVYISGKITGLKPKDYLTRFYHAQLKLQDEGFEVINPAVTQATMPPCTTYDQFMQMSMLELSFCGSIYMLSNWKESKGAKKEHHYAVVHGYSIRYEEDEI